VDGLVVLHLMKIKYCASHVGPLLEIHYKIDVYVISLAMGEGRVWNRGNFREFCTTLVWNKWILVALLYTKPFIDIIRNASIQHCVHEC